MTIKEYITFILLTLSSHCISMHAKDTLFLFNRETTELSEEHIMKKIFTAQTLKNYSLPVISSDGIKDIPDSLFLAKIFTENLSNVVYKKLTNIQINKSSEKDIIRLIELRNLLLEAGGYFHSSLAGSLTYAINGLLLDGLASGKKLSPIARNVYRLNKIKLKTLVGALNKGPEVDQRGIQIDLSSDDFHSKTNAVLIQKILQIHGVNVTLGEFTSPEVWQKADPTLILNYRFGDQLCLAESSVIHLANWAIIIDEQFAIHILDKLNESNPSLLAEYEKQKNSEMVRINELLKKMVNVNEPVTKNELQQEYIRIRNRLRAAESKIEEKIDIELQNTSDIYRCQTFEKWKAKKIYNFLRKYKSYAPQNDRTPFEDRLIVCLKFYNFN